ncbi:hypothetical protein RHA1_ro06986 [Rhodococcus jostii RHA1]|uniref:Uncharacterized protein n=1 Tax=Rhodococcus jostii (strain RHA1) TaxID=101510 RepID=Q0S134_RHOJR|nr:hypothetical protein RHA1_ro06986 [Rhodococcus jostii RHA1]
MLWRSECSAGGLVLVRRASRTASVSRRRGARAPDPVYGRHPLGRVRALLVSVVVAAVEQDRVLVDDSVPLAPGWPAYTTPHCDPR